MNDDLPRDIEAMQEAFIRCHALERREAGGGRWPFAGDGPWNLIQRDANDWWDGAWSDSFEVNARGQEVAIRLRDVPAPRVPLSSLEVDELARLRRWLLLVPDAASPLGCDHDRRLVWYVTGKLHRGDHGDGGRVPWTEIRGLIGSPRSPDALVLRYRKALAVVVCRLNGWPLRRVRALAG